MTDPRSFQISSPVIRRMAADCLDAHLADVAASSEPEVFDGRPYDGAHFVDIDFDDGSQAWLDDYNDER